MAHKTLINGTAYDIKGGKTLVNGTGYDIKKGRTLVGGTGYDIGFGIPISSLSVGSSVYINVNGVRTEFLIVNQGKPQNSNIYDDSCNGTWLLMKEMSDDIRSFAVSGFNDYANSSIQFYLINEFLPSLEPKMQDIIKQVKIPYRPGMGSSSAVYSGDKGLSTKIFLLSADEINCPGEPAPLNEGACLSYFSDTPQTGPSSKRVAYIGTLAYDWWLRSPFCSPYYPTFNDVALRVTQTGALDNRRCDFTFGVRPAFIVPFNTKIDDNFNIIV